MKNIIFLTALIILAVTIIFPGKTLALSITQSFPPSDFFEVYLDLFLLLTVFLLTILLVFCFLFRKVKKAGSGSKSKVSKLMLKALTLIGILLLIFRLSLQIGYIRDLINRDYYASAIRYPYYPPDGTVIVTEKIIVGFKKGVSQEKAEEYLKNEKAKFTRTENANMGKIFFYNTDLKYIVTSSFFDVDKLIVKFKSSPLVYDALKYSNNPNEIID